MGSAYAGNRQKVQNAALQSDFEKAQAATAPKDPVPPAAPDLTDEVVKKARQAALQRQQSAQGQRSTFLTGPRGLATPPKTLLGG
jgi:hypothetical protein